MCAGNEGHGLHKEVEKQCDAMISVGAHRSLPLGFDSLNVSVATGILLYNLQNHAKQ
jgi:tRNA G18 (ribose-2'-O)-methylase SpoU